MYARMGGPLCESGIITVPLHLLLSMGLFS